MRKINIFWNWFQDNNQTIKNLVNETVINQNQICYWLNKQLSYYSKELDFIIVFPKKENQKTELIITANGNPEYFKQVIQLIDNSPKLRHWKFTAFTQPTENINKIIYRLDEPYIIPEITIKSDDNKFLSLVHDDKIIKLNIIIYLKHYYIQCNTTTLQQAIYIILNDLSGKKLVCENINFVQLAKTTDDEIDIIILYELQWYSDM